MAKPLSAHADSVLWSLHYGGPVPRQEINNGAVDRLMRGRYIEETQGVSPYKVHKGRNIPFVKITAKGEQYLKDGI